MGFIEVKEESDIWKPEEAGEQLTGILEAREQTGQWKNLAYKIRADGEIRTLFGTKILNDKMSKILIGANIKIVYNGEKKSQSGRIYKDWSVFIDDKDVVETQKITG